MSSRLYWDKDKRLILAYDPAELTAQQRANITLLQSVLESEYRRGFNRGYSIAYGQFAGDGRAHRAKRQTIDLNAMGEPSENSP